MKTREIISWTFCALLLLVLCYLLMLDAWGLTLVGDVVDHTKFGTWGQMVSAIGTTIAFLIGLANLITVRSNYKAGEDRRKEEEETSVFIWLSPIEDIDEKTEEHVGWQWVVNILNSTKSPIYNWKISFDREENHLCSLQKNPLLPKLNSFNLPFLDEVEPNNSPTATIIFESKSGIIWSRTVKGLLIKVTEQETVCNHSTIKK